MKTLFTLIFLSLSFLTIAQVDKNSQWTWINGDSLNTVSVYGTKGVSASTNKPGARGNSISWTDASGNFWLFGGYGNAPSGPFQFLNDL